MDDSDLVVRNISETSSRPLLVTSFFALVEGHYFYQFDDLIKVMGQIWMQFAYNFGKRKAMCSVGSPTVEMMMRNEGAIMQARYPEKYPQVHWDTVNVEYPVRNLGHGDVSSEAIARKWRTQPEVLHVKPRAYINEIQEYSQDYNICKSLSRSQTSLDYEYKIPEVKRFNKHTSCTQNEYIYPPSRRLEDQPPACHVHGTTEMKESYAPPRGDSRLVTHKHQLKHPVSSERNLMPMEASWQKELESMDTTCEGYEKYLDPYLTTSRLHHRPYTTEQLKNISNSKDIVTYYTLADVPWVWSTKPKHEDWFLRLKTPKTMKDRERFKGDFREIRTHNRLQWVPGSFRTEVKDNYGFSQPRCDLGSEKYDEVSTEYRREIAKLKTNSLNEDPTIQGNYTLESSNIGLKKPICTVFEQCVEKNKRLMSKLAHNNQ